MVLSFFATLGSYFKPSVLTDDIIFRLHYNLTSVLLVAFSIIVSTKQFFGDPISCIPSARTETPLNLLDNYCWSHSTFTLPKAHNKPMAWGTQEVAYAGIDNEVPGDDVVYHAYYQWVCFFLFVQALFFYLTKYLWSNAFGKDLQKLLTKKRIKDPEKLLVEGSEMLRVKDIVKLVDDKEKLLVKDIEGLAGYLSSTLGCHGWAVFTYFLCLVLNGANAIAQMYLTNAFLRGEFMTYGLEVLYFPMTPQVNRTDPMVRVFPLVTKCKFPRYGVGGSVEIRDTLCVLPVNVINEKIFIFLWFWYAILAFISLAWMVCQIPFIFNKFRTVAIKCRKTGEVKNLLDIVMPKCQLGDWFLLRIVEKNYVATDFKTLMTKLGMLLEAPSEDTQPLVVKTSDYRARTGYLTKAMRNAEDDKHV